MAVDFSTLSDAELERMAALPDAELESAVGGGGSVAGAVWEGVKHGATRAAQGLRQVGLNIAERVTPAGLVSPSAARAYQENAARQNREYTDYLRREIPRSEAEVSRVREAHPLAFAGGDIAGGVAVTLPAAVLVPGSGLGGWMAQGAVQGLAQPALGEDYTAEKTRQGISGAVAGTAGGAVLSGVGKGLVGLVNFPKQFLNRAQRRRMETPYAREGERVAEETGMSLSPAAVSGSRVATMAENISKQSMWSGDRAQEAYDQLSRQAVDHADRITSTWTAGRGPRDAASIGQELRDTTRNAVRVIHDQAGARYARDIDDVVGKSPPAFDFSHTKGALQQTVKENEFSVTPEGIRLRDQAQTLLDRLGAFESAGIRNADMSALVDLVDNAYQRASARFPDQAQSVIGQGGFGKIINDRAALESVYSRLDTLARATPERVLGPRPDGPVSLSQAVRDLGGLNATHMPDVIGESTLSAQVRSGMPRGLFVKNGGRSPDDMARALVEEGYLRPGEAVGDDGVRAMYEKIGAELAGRGRYFRPDDIGRAQAREAWDVAASRAMSAVVPDAIPVPGGAFPIKAAIAMRRDIGKAARGTGNLFDDIHPAEDRRLAGVYFGAINQDFESAANNAVGDAGAAFQRANQRYRQAMSSIDYIENSALGRLLGKDVVDALHDGGVANTAGAAEMVVNQITKLQPSKVGQLRVILERINPTLLQDVKAWTLSQAMERGQTLAPSAGTRSAFDPAKAATGMLTPRQRAELYSADELHAINTFDEGLRRWADKHGFNTSGTAPASEFLSMVNRIGVGALGIGTAVGSAIAGGPLGMLGTAASLAATGRYIFGTRQIAEAMVNPGDRRQLLKLLALPEGSRQAATIAAGLVSRYATRNDSVSVPEQRNRNGGGETHPASNQGSQ